MTRFAVSLLVTSMMTSSAAGFTPALPRPQQSAPFFVTVFDKEPEMGAPVMSQDGVAQPQTQQQLQLQLLRQEQQSVPAPKKKAAAAKAGAHSKGGVLAPFVILAKKALGEAELNQLRGKAIGIHSKVIGGFVNTSNSPTGEMALKALFELADTDKSGTIEEQELAKALRTLGFELRDQQIKGIFDRADKDANGALDYEEWRKEAPSTLRTNLKKLAKRNGGDLGLMR